MQCKSVFISMVLLASMLCRASDIPKKVDTQTPQQSQPRAPSLALSPAVIMIKAGPGASSTHPMTMTNLTNTRFRFVLEAFDVVIQGGKRVFVPAGETEGGIARSAIFDPPAIELNPGESAQIKVTLTVPAEHRLLPGEEFDYAVEYPHNLRPGKYRAMMSLEHEGGVQTSNIEFEVR